MRQVSKGFNGSLVVALLLLATSLVALALEREKSSFGSFPIALSGLGLLLTMKEKCYQAKIAFAGEGNKG
jgi:hypothetical protein